MANFDLSNYVKAQTKVLTDFSSAEMRFRQPELFKLYLRNRDIMTPNYKEVKKSTQRAVESDYFLRQSRVLGSTIEHNHAGAQGDSGVITPTWSLYSDKYSSWLKRPNNSIYDMAELHFSEMSNVIANFTEGLESAASDYTFANRTQVSTAYSDTAWDATDFVHKITESTNKDGAVNITKLTMDVNKYQGKNYTIVCDPVSFRKFEAQANQGTGNSVNTSFQFSGVSFILDPDLSADAAGLVGNYTAGFWLVIPDGYVSFLDWIEPQYVQGVNSKEATFGSIINPIDSLQYGLHTYEERADGTAFGGYAQDLKIETQIHIQGAFEVAPLSVANATPITAFAFV